MNVGNNLETLSYFECSGQWSECNGRAAALGLPYRHPISSKTSFELSKASVFEICLLSLSSILSFLG